MPIGIIGKKLGITQIFDRHGRLVPVTVVQAGPCPVVQIKTKENDGYTALQLGFEAAGKKRSATKPIVGHFEKANVEPQKVLKEFRIEDVSEYKLGDQFTVDMFSVLENVTVSGVSKGRGFTGVIKRHGFAGKDRGHGAHEAYRHGGSIGCRTPKRVIKGMKMPGRMGTQQFKVKNLKVLFIDREKNLLLIKGPVPGWKNGYVTILKSK